MKSRVSSLPRSLKTAERLAAPSSRRAFTATPRTAWRATLVRSQESHQGDQQKSKQDKQAEPDLQPGKSPFQAFVEVVREEIERNRQLQQDMKQLGGKVDSMADSKAWGAVRDTYERARVSTPCLCMCGKGSMLAHPQLTASIQENPRLRKAAEDLMRTGGQVNDAIEKAVSESYIYRGLSSGAAAAYAASEPIRQTDMYKALAASVDDVLKDVKYGGFVDKEARRRRRQIRLEQIGKTKGMAKQRRKPVKVEEDPECVMQLI